MNYTCFYMNSFIICIHYSAVLITFYILLDWQKKHLDRIQSCLLIIVLYLQTCSQKYILQCTCLLTIFAYDGSQSSFFYAMIRYFIQVSNSVILHVSPSNIVLEVSCPSLVLSVFYMNWLSALLTCLMSSTYHKQWCTVGKDVAIYPIWHIPDSGIMVVYRRIMCHMQWCKMVIFVILQSYFPFPMLILKC